MILVEIEQQEEKNPETLDIIIGYNNNFHSNQNP